MICPACKACDHDHCWLVIQDEQGQIVNRICNVANHTMQDFAHERCPAL